MVIPTLKEARKMKKLSAIILILAATLLFAFPAGAADLNLRGSIWTVDGYPGWEISLTGCMFSPCGVNSGEVMITEPDGKTSFLSQGWSTTGLTMSGLPGIMSPDGKTITLFTLDGGGLVLQRLPDSPDGN
jgi:hypothetical protein